MRLAPIIASALLVVGQLSFAQPAATEPPPDADPKHARDLESDEKLGAEYSAQVDKELKLSQDKEGQERISRIGGKLAEIANRTHVRVSWGDSRLNPFHYKFKLIEGKDVNAFSLPGGTIYVYEGLLKYAETDDELAGVLAHEIAHASLRHIATLRREASKLEAITIPLILIGVLTGNAAIASGTSMFSQAQGSGWSVKAEKAADLAAFDYLKDSGFNSVGLLTMMERLAYDDRNRPKIDWGIFQTHPPSAQRAEALRDLFNEAKIPILRSRVSTSMRAQVVEATDGTVTLTHLGRKIFVFRGEDASARAKEAATKLNNCFDVVPKIYEVTAFDSDGIEYKDEVLIQVTDADAAGTNKSVSELQDQALKAIKASIYEIRYRVWDFFAT
jgi:predicted Zn-dependent protease